MKRHTNVILAAAVAFALVGGLVATSYAQNGRLVRQKLAQRTQLRGQALALGLKLTQDQREQVKAILAGHKDELKTVAQENAQARKDVAAALAQGADQQTLRSAYKLASEAGWDRLMLRSNIFSEIKPILTPEQLQRLQKRNQLKEKLVKKAIKRFE
jgi:Spy/CpxP family protein refolding chaperone